MAKGKLLVVSGPSGVGKGTICNQILSADSNIMFSVSMTTRSPREGEVDAVNYFFTDKESFEKLLAEGGLLEHNCYCGNYYGTPRKQVEAWLEEGKDVMLEIDFNGAFQIRESYPECVMIFILPPSMEALRSRIEGRGTENEETIQKRLDEAATEMSHADEYDYRVVNDNLEDAIKQVQDIIDKERNN